ncbi:hypothetical protein [Haloferula sp. BvORR071]|uniref:hypothetical protein n=1 Tax=Haloferula sp. BvORR071 TaxID=1396141 RepID=UPI00055981FA|nr:hypothetical protein [Haloferula sp. BvORR071]
MKILSSLLLALAAAGGSWIGYLAGAGPDLAETMWAAREKPTTTREARRDTGHQALSRPNATDVLLKLKSGDPGGSNRLLQAKAWEDVRTFTAEQCREGLRVTGTGTIEEMSPPGAEMLFFRWAEVDPQAAMGAAMDLSKPFNLQYARSVLAAWFKNDPEAAYRWSKSDPRMAKNLRTEEMMGSVLLGEPAESAMAKAMLMGEGVRERVFCVNGAIAGSSGKEERDAFIKKLSKFGEDERYAGTRLLLRSWGAQEPREVLDHWDEFSYQDRPGGRPVRDEILGRWGARQPAEAMTWLDENPLPDRQARQLDIYSRWVERDSEAAGQWLEGRENAGDYAELLVKQALSQALNNTMDHFSSKQVTERRDELLRRHYQLWERKQPEAATVWLNQLDAASADKIRGDADEGR